MKAEREFYSDLFGGFQDDPALDISKFKKGTHTGTMYNPELNKWAIDQIETLTAEIEALKATIKRMEGFIEMMELQHNPPALHVDFGVVND